METSKNSNEAAESCGCGPTCCGGNPESRHQNAGAGASQGESSCCATTCCTSDDAKSRGAGEDQSLPVVVIGAGPVGLAAAAHLHERGLPFVVVEAGEGVGTHLHQWSHVQMFSPWEFNVDAASARLLAAVGWQRPPADHYPTGGDLARRYLEPLASHPALAPALRLGQRVVAISRDGLDKVKTAGRDQRGREQRPFLVRTVNRAGQLSELRARAVIDASGTWGRKSPAGAHGLPALGEETAPVAYGIPDLLGQERTRYAGRRVMVVGGGHSAMNALLDLATLCQQVPGTRVWWVIRGEAPQYGGGAADMLAARGELGQRLSRAVSRGEIEVITRFEVEAFDRGAEGTVVSGRRAGEAATLPAVDEIIVATGLRPDLSFLGELRLDLDPALECSRTLAPLIDPNVHSCGSVRPHGEAELRLAEAGIYLIGMKSYGRAPTFLLATGYEQARSVVAYLAGDEAAARRVELKLPETGVCKLDRTRQQVRAVATACCG